MFLETIDFDSNDFSSDLYKKENTTQCLATITTLIQPNKSDH